MTPTVSVPAAKASRKGLKALLLAAAFAVTFVAGGLTLSAAPALAMDMAMGHAMGGHGDMHARAHAHLDKMLTEVDATPEQKAKIDAIFKTAFQSIGPMHERLAASHKDLHQLLTAPSIDRAALENLRTARMADLDQASKTLVGALADAADVLTPEQRAKLGKLMEAHHHHSGPMS